MFVYYLNCHRFWKCALDISLTGTYICRHTHMHVGDDKNLIWPTRPTSASDVTLCHRVLLLLLYDFGVKILRWATQASILTAMIYFLLLHIKCISQENSYIPKTCMCSWNHVWTSGVVQIYVSTETLKLIQPENLKAVVGSACCSVLEYIPFDIFPTRYNITQFIYFWKSSIHVSVDVSTHHQEHT
jgi:hypothetical protein